MAHIRTLTLIDEVRQEQIQHRDHDPRPYVRKRCAALLKIAEGKALYWEAHHSLLKPHDPDSVYAWLDTYETSGLTGLIARQHGGDRRSWRDI